MRLPELRPGRLCTKLHSPRPLEYFLGLQHFLLSSKRAGRGEAADLSVSSCLVRAPKKIGKERKCRTTGHGAHHSLSLLQLTLGSSGTKSRGHLDTNIPPGTLAGWPFSAARAGTKTRL